MAKRSATTELNHDNWDQEREEKEHAGTFIPLSTAELQNRIIKKGKRGLDASSSSGSSSIQGVSPFAKFAGFTSNASSSFSSIRNTNSSGAASPFSVSHKKEIEKQSVNNSMKLSEMNSNTTTESVSKNSVSDATAKEAIASKTRCLDYYRQLQSLNESVLKWMQHHLEKNACCDFMPVFNDYKKHMDTLNLTYPIANKRYIKDKDEVFKSPSVSKEDQSASKAFNKSNTKVNSVSSNANNGNTDGETDYGAHFTSNTTNTSTVSYGIKLTPTATSTGSPMGPTSSSKEDPNVEKKNSSQFSFDYFSKGNQLSTDKSFSFATAPTEKSSESGNANVDSEYVPPKNDFVAVAEEDALYSKRCKLFFKKGEVYADKGVGTLYIKSLEGKTQLVVRADTNLGNILLNIMLTSSLPMSKTGKNNVLLVCIPNPPVDAKKPDSKEAIPILIRVKTSEDADELLQALNEHKS